MGRETLDESAEEEKKQKIKGNPEKDRDEDRTK